MIVYDKYRLYSLNVLFALTGSAIPRIIPYALIGGAWAFVIMYFNLADPDDSIVATEVGTFSAIFGIISLALAFHSNQAYNRFWEARTQLADAATEWLNVAQYAITYDEPSDSLGVPYGSLWRAHVSHLVSLLHAVAISYLYRGPREMHIIGGMTMWENERLEESQDQTYLVSRWLLKSLTERLCCGGLPMPAPIMNTMFSKVGEGLKAFNQACKIEDTPFPLPYVQLMQIFMIIITIILPLVIASTGISIYFGVPASFFGLLIFHAWVSAAHAMESPFGDRPNDLPLAELQEEFNGRLQQLIRSTQIHSAGVAYGDQIDLSEGAILFSPTRKDAEGSEVEEEDEEGVIVAGLETLDGFGGREVEGSGANLSVLRPGISDSVTADAETSVPPVPANNQAGLSKPQMLQMQMLQEESGVPMWRRSAAGSVAIVASTVSPPTQPVATPHSVNTDAAFGSTFRLGSELVPASDAVRGFSGPSAGEDSSGTQGINPVTVSQSGPTAAGSLHASHTNSVGPLPTTELPVKLTTLGASRGPQHKDTKYKSVWGSRRPSAPAATASLKPADISLQVSPPPFPPHANTSQGLTGSASGDAGLGLQAPQDIQAARTNTDPTGLQTTGEALPPSADAQPPMLPTSPGTALNLTLPSDDMEGGKQEKENQKSPKAEKGALKPPAGQNPSTGRNSLASPVSDILSVMPSDLSPYGGSSGLALPPPAVVGDSGDVDDGEGRDGQPGRGMKQPIAKVKSMPSVLGYANSSVKSPEGSRVTPSSPDQAPLGRAASAGEGGVQTPGRGRVTPLPLSPNPSIPRDMRSHTRIGTRFSVWRQQSEDEEGGPFGRYGAAALQQRSSLRVLRGNNGRPHHTEGTQLIIPGADRAARLGMNIRSIPSFGIGLDADFAGLSASPGEKTVDLPMQKNRRPGSVAPWELHHHHNGPHHGLGVGGPSRFLTGRESTFGGIRSPRPEPDDRERDGEAGTGKDRDKDKMRQGGRQGTESPQRRKTGAESVASTRRSWWRMSIGSRSGGLAGSKSHGPLRREGTASVKGSSPVNPSDLKSEESAGGRQRSFSDDGFVTYGEGRERERERERGRKVASPVKKHGTPGPSRQKRDGKTAARVSIILPGGGEEDPHHSSSVDPELAENAGIQNLG